MSGARHRRKGDRIEREVVDRHKALGIHAERYPLSGASRFRGSGHDLDLYIFGREKAPAVAEVKGRKNGAGFTTLERRIRCAVSSPQQYRSARAPTLAHVGAHCRTGAAMTIHAPASIIAPHDTSPVLNGDDLLEIPSQLEDEIASWRRVMHATGAEGARDQLRRAAVDLFQALLTIETGDPTRKAVAYQATIDALQEFADFHDIGTDDAQHIISDARKMVAASPSPVTQGTGARTLVANVAFVASDTNPP
jgi:hypothetical protein